MIPRVLIIAEAGVNHDGDTAKALALVQAAKDAGADIVKFQTFKADRLVTKHTPKANYQIQATGHDSQQSMIRRLELSAEAHHAIKKHCRALDIEFLSTGFDLGSLDFLVNEVGLDRIKIPSGEITNGPLVLAAARCGKPLILSTGMARLGEIEEALALIAFGRLVPEELPQRDKLWPVFASAQASRTLANDVTLLHCTTEYPAPFKTVNLNSLHTLARAFGTKVGLSDHSSGINMPVAAVALGASLIEKHITLNKNDPGPDHSASLEPGEFKDMVAAIRQVEQALGSGIKLPTDPEFANLPVVRKYLVASRTIRQGEPFSPENLTAKRAGHGISPMEYWALLGRKAQQDFAVDQVIEI